MADFSPAAKAVVAAIEKFDWESGHFCREDIWTLSRKVTAAALRAAADLVAPDDYKCFTGNLEWDAGMEARTDDIREELLAIAAELENQ